MWLTSVVVKTSDWTCPALMSCSTRWKATCEVVLIALT